MHNMLVYFTCIHVQCKNVGLHIGCWNLDSYFSYCNNLNRYAFLSFSSVYTNFSYWLLFHMVKYYSNAIKFTHEGKVGINLQVVSEESEKYSGSGGEHHQVIEEDNSSLSATRLTENAFLDSQRCENLVLHNFS